MLSSGPGITGELGLCVSCHNIVPLLDPGLRGDLKPSLHIFFAEKKSWCVKASGHVYGIEWWGRVDTQSHMAEKSSWHGKHLLKGASLRPLEAAQHY